MATLEEILNAADGVIDSSDLSLDQINSRITDLTESKNEMITRVCEASRNEMINLISFKTDKFTSSDNDANGTGPILSEYQYVLGANFWNGQTSGTSSLSLSDWTIQKRTRPTIMDDWSSWATIYDYTNVQSENSISFIQTKENFDYGWDYVIQDPENLDGSYGLNKNIELLGTGKTVIENDRQKAVDSNKILGRILS
jgi:hypothetical protein